jgi:hypothetical protein
VLALALMAGCGPEYTYPAAKVSESVEKICADEYKIKVEARVVGKTLGALFFMDNALDNKGQLSKEVHEQMGKVMQALTRVSLSTDLPLDYCTVILRDRVYANELIITRSVDDTKRANAEMIGVEESINRTVFGQRHVEVNAKNEPFVLKEILPPDFLADQVVQRVRYASAKDSKDETQTAFLLMDGSYEAAEKTFRFSYVSLKPADPKQTLLDVFHQTNLVLAAYHFTALKQIEILDYMHRQKLVMDAQALAQYQDKKITDNDVFAKYVTQSATVQEAFKLFGFSSPASGPDDAAAAVPMAEAAH